MKPWSDKTIKNTCEIGGSVVPLGGALFVGLAGFVVPGLVAGLLAGSAVWGLVLSDAASAGVASGVLDGGGEALEEAEEWLEEDTERDAAISSGAVAALSVTGLTVEPTSTPNASNTITAIAVTSGEGMRDSVGGEEGERGGELSAGAAPISAAIAGASGPRRVPHSTQ